MELHNTRQKDGLYGSRSMRGCDVFLSLSILVSTSNTSIGFLDCSSDALLKENNEKRLKGIFAIHTCSTHRTFYNKQAVRMYRLLWNSRSMIRKCTTAVMFDTMYFLSMSLCVLLQRMISQDGSGIHLCTSSVMNEFCTIFF